MLLDSEFNANTARGDRPLPSPWASRKSTTTTTGLSHTAHAVGAAVRRPQRTDLHSGESRMLGLLLQKRRRSSLSTSGGGLRARYRLIWSDVMIFLTSPPQDDSAESQCLVQI